MFFLFRFPYLFPFLFCCIVVDSRGRLFFFYSFVCLLFVLCCGVWGGFVSCFVAIRDRLFAVSSPVRVFPTFYPMLNLDGVVFYFSVCLDYLVRQFSSTRRRFLICEPLLG